MPSTTGTRISGQGLVAYFALACSITWLLGLALALAWIRGDAPAPFALALAGLSAFGPTLAAIAVAAPRGELREVFGRWRTNPVWVLVALFVPMALHLAANVLEFALGGRPTEWFYPPVLPEHLAALVTFSIGEEFGWRGFAYPRLVRRWGPVIGSLILGAVWGLWHLLMLVSPETGALDGFALGRGVLELSLYSVVIGWVFERGGRSMAVAIAIHAGGHLDNTARAPETEVRLWILRFVVLALVAAFAARSLAAKARAAEPSPLEEEH